MGHTSCHMTYYSVGYQILWFPTNMHIHSCTILFSPSTGKTCGTPGRRRKPPTYRSVISDIFDGTIVSSVQCLTCNTISSRKETFQDLSLPIPSSDQLSILQHSSASQLQQVAGSSLSSSSLHLAKTSCDTATDGLAFYFLFNHDN